MRNTTRAGSSCPAVRKGCSITTINPSNTAQAAGHVAGHAQQDRGEKGTEEFHEREPAVREQDEQHRCGERPIQTRKRELGECQTRRRQRQFELSYSKRLSPDDCCCEVRKRCEHHQPSCGSDERRQLQQVWERADRQAQPAESQYSEPERHRV